MRIRGSANAAGRLLLCGLHLCYMSVHRITTCLLGRIVVQKRLQYFLCLQSCILISQVISALKVLNE